MSKRKASRRARDAKHVRLYLYMLKSPAWLSLSCQAKCLLIELLALYNGTNNGELYLSVRDAAKLLHTGLHQASAAFAELEERGFIRATRKGSRTRRGETRLATCWRLTEYDDDLTGRQPTKEFMTWHLPPAEAPVASKRTERSRKANDARWGRKNMTVAAKDTHRCQQGYGQDVEGTENILDRRRQGHAQANSEASSVAAKDTQLVNHVETPKITAPLSRAAPAGAGATHTKSSLARLGGSRRERAEWLQAQLDAGALSIHDVMATLEIGDADVRRLAEGKIAVSPQRWNKLAALLAGRLN
jgi:hypothetical protein